MADLTAPICVACGGSDSREFWRDQTRTIRQCRACGLLFVFPQPDRTTLHSQFQSDYFTHGHADSLTRLELEFEAWRRPTLAGIVKRIRKLKATGKLLDVGCASGEIFEYFRDGDWELYGIEPSAMAFARLRQRFGPNPQLHLFNGYLRDACFETNSLDVITVLESLYYMPDPRHELSYVARILRDDGLLAIALPGYTYQRLMHCGPISYLVNGTRCSLTPSHLFYFSDKSLSMLLKSQGFRVFDTLQLGSSAYGSGFGRFTRQTYLPLVKALSGLTLGQINLAPHVLYLCQKSDGL
jgi:SAM-dependent methyltransferase